MLYPPAHVSMASRQQTMSTMPLDCFSCRLLGTSAFALLGVYAIASARYYGANKAISAGPGAILGIRLVGYSKLMWRDSDTYEAKRSVSI